MATVQDTMKQISFVDDHLRSAVTWLLRANDTQAYYLLAQAQHELCNARLFVAESEADQGVVERANQDLAMGNYALGNGLDALLGKTHTVYRSGKDLSEVSPDREYVMGKVHEARTHVLACSGGLALDLVSGTPLSTHMRLLEAESEYPAPHYEAGHE